MNSRHKLALVYMQPDNEILHFHWRESTSTHLDECVTHVRTIAFLELRYGGGNSALHRYART